MRAPFALVATSLVLAFALTATAQQPQGTNLFSPQALTNGQPAQTKLQLTKALQGYREKKDLHGEAITLLFLGINELSLNNPEGARSGLEEAIRKMSAQSDAVGAWLGYLVLAQLENALGKPEHAVANMENAFAVIQKAKTSSAPFTMRTFVTIAKESGLPASMLDMIESSAELMKPMILEYFLEPMAHDIFGSMLTEAGQLERAEAELNAALAGSVNMQGMYDYVIAGHFGDLRFRQTRFDEARTQYKKALSGSLQMPMNPMGEQWIKAGIYDRLARVEAATGHIDEAIGWNDKSVEMSRAANMPLQECMTIQTRGQILMRSDRLAEAESALKDALKIAEATKNAGLRAPIETQLGNLDLMRGNYGSAAAHLEKAIRLFQSANNPVSEAAAWGMLAHARLLTDDLAAAEDALSHARKLADEKTFSPGNDMIAMTDVWIRFRKGQAAPADVKASVEKFMANARVANVEMGQDVQQIVRHVLRDLEAAAKTIP